jgi:hypothetical protein
MRMPRLLGSTSSMVPLARPDRCCAQHWLTTAWLTPSAHLPACREVQCQLQEAEHKAQVAAAENERLAARVVELEGQLGISSGGVLEGGRRSSSEGEQAGAGGLVHGSSEGSDGGGAAMKDMTNMAAEAAGRAGAEHGQVAGAKVEEGDGGGVRQRKKGAAAQQ